jgi:hypothetical protein
MCVCVYVLTPFLSLNKGLEQRFPNWWGASRFVMGRQKFLKCDFFNYIKIRNHEKWESEKTKN